MLFDELSPVDMTAALARAPKELVEKALTLYVELAQKLSKDDLVSVLDDDKHPAFKSVKDAYDKWAAVAQRFRTSYGEGIVVGVVWGGIGVSKMTIEDQAAGASRKYGGAAEFSYAGVGASLSVGATYDASGSTDTSENQSELLE